MAFATVTVTQYIATLHVHLWSSLYSAITLFVYPAHRSGSPHDALRHPSYCMTGDVKAEKYGDTYSNINTLRFYVSLCLSVCPSETEMGVVFR